MSTGKNYLQNLSDRSGVLPSEPAQGLWAENTAVAMRAQRRPRSPLLPGEQESWAVLLLLGASPPPQTPAQPGLAAGPGAEPAWLPRAPAQPRLAGPHCGYTQNQLLALNSAIMVPL